jgi:hypothetical protein
MRAGKLQSNIREWLVYHAQEVRRPRAGSGMVGQSSITDSSGVGNFFQRVCVQGLLPGSRPPKVAQTSQYKRFSVPILNWLEYWSGVTQIC